MVENTHLKPALKDASSKEVIIFGVGACAQRTAANLAKYGVHTFIASKRPVPPGSVNGDKIDWFPDSQLVSCKGFAGDFDLVLSRQNALVRKKVTAIVVAEDHKRIPNYEPYGVSPNARILDISSLEEKIRDAISKETFKDGARIAFLCGWKIDSLAGITRRMMQCCLRLQEEAKITTLFMTGNLKVAANGAEDLYHQAKKAGTLFLKFTNAFPSIHVKTDGRFDIEYEDELTRTHFGTTADWLVVDETLAPGHGLTSIIEVLEIERDEQGFAQIDNVHRLNHGTNRRGIFVAGGARGKLSDDEQRADADQVTMKVLAFLNNRDAAPLPKVEIHRGRCARCLTCHRLCPHKAIDIGRRISVVPQACQSCGICMAGCPARAIDMQGMQISEDVKQWCQPSSAHSEQSKSMPYVLVLGCGRSAGQAYQLSRMMGYVMPPGVCFIEVPCGGSVSVRHLLAAYDFGADGVMLCTCHTDNCMSDKGNKLAHRQAESTLELLNAAGMERERLDVTSLAANMANEFYLRVNAFVDRIQSLNRDLDNNPTTEDDHHGPKQTGSY